MAGKTNKYSYSKVNTYKSCGWKYYLTYNEGHFTYSDTLVSELGTLVHHCEEVIGGLLQRGIPVDYDKLKDEFLNINIPKTSKFDLKGGIYGANLLKQKYPMDYFKTNDRGQSFATKVDNYLNSGIYRLENWLKMNPGYKVYGVEKYFSISFCDQTLSGYIDRIFYNEEENTYIIEDIKTKDKPFKDEELVTPLQFVFYNMALQNIINDPSATIMCRYDLPMCEMKQDAGTSGFVKRGEDELRQIFSKIEQKDFAPSPSPLCAWCPFSPTNPNQPEEGKLLCPYYSLWTPEKKVYAVAASWEGMEHHKEKMEAEISKQSLVKEDDIDFDF